MGQCASSADLYSASNQNLYQNLAQQEAIDQFYAHAGRVSGAEAERDDRRGRRLAARSAVVCWGNELDMGAAHNHDDTPFVLIGGANGQLKTGNLVTFPLDQSGS